MFKEQEKQKYTSIFHIRSKVLNENVSVDPPKIFLSPQISNKENPFLNPKKNRNHVHQNMPKNIFTNDSSAQFKVEDRSGCPDEVKASKIRQQYDDQSDQIEIKHEQKKREKKESEHEKKKKEKKQLKYENFKLAIRELQEQLRAEKSKNAELNARFGKFIELQKFHNLRVELENVRIENTKIRKDYENQLNKARDRYRQLENNIHRKNKQSIQFKKFLGQQNLQIWLKIDNWIQNFEIFSYNMTAKIPNKTNEINQILKRCEQQIITYVQKQLMRLPTAMRNILQEVESTKEKQLLCLKKTSEKIIKLLEEQKRQYKSQNITLSEETIALTTQPLQDDIDSANQYLKTIRFLIQETDKHLYNPSDRKQSSDLLMKAEKKESLSESNREKAMLNID